MDNCSYNVQSSRTNVDSDGNYTRDFSRFDKVRFITLVRKHEALYSSQHPNYTNKQYVESVYSKIAAEVGLKGGATAARNKWNSLKICYKFHKRKLQNPSNKRKPHKKWPYSEMMQFIDQYITTKKGPTSRWNQTVEPPSASTCSSYLSDASHPAIETNDVDPKPPTEFYVKQEPHFRGTTGDQQTSMPQKQSPQNQWHNPVDTAHRSNMTGIGVATETTTGAVAEMDSTQLAELVTMVKDLQAAVGSMSRQENDDDSQYGRFIASRLQKLTPRQKHSVRKGIEDVFYEVESQIEHHVPTIDSVMGEVLN